MKKIISIISIMFLSLFFVACDSKTETKEVKKEEKAVIDENKKVITKEDILGDNQLNTSIAILKSLIIMNK